ncbi:twin-arginine translocase TatA/TatE family subunit [Mucilaginibacter sabulilitoris]|uniref:Sec-independent protein translocase protein TatA n=1 Tax=Mucilaginibacter sabulilitoris TaxID=1173583 RepID=A0ABZ0TK23_9SPHI|nr:twin-arginine translocase TatA/TatE family subunit [Mucilaginibacter sabulilitoris]WPU93510.1 twin-arginine translocase TatA/TatE family subunit [Mucilaginibacter sabulilitoris]
MLSSVFLFLNIGTSEMVLILFAALMLFGGDKLPELARGLGKGIRDFKDASDDVKREINNQINNYEEKKTETKVQETPLIENKTEDEASASLTEESETEYTTPYANSVPNTIPVADNYVSTEPEPVKESHIDLTKKDSEPTKTEHEEYKS